MIEDIKARTLGALDDLFNKRDYAKAEAFFSEDYIQHSRFVPAGRSGLFELAKSLPTQAKYEPGLTLVDGDHVMVQGRYSGLGGPTLIAVDVFRIENGRAIEHWDVIQEEASRSESAGDAPMFGDSFPNR